MYGFKPRRAQEKPVQHLADGGLVHSITGMLGMRKRTPEELLAADAKAQARNQEAAAARAAARNQSAQENESQPAKAISSYAGMSAMQRREKAAGLKDGGTVGGFKPGGIIRGPGTGTSDSIQTEKRPGTFIMPADSTQAIGPEALEEMGEVEGREDEGEDQEESGEKVPVNLSNGEFELPPEQVQAIGQAVLTVLRDATHTPVGESKPVAGGFAPNQFFANGGTVQDDERLKRVAQIPTGSDVRAPASDGQDSTELTRNVNNGLNALGGMGVVASVPLRAGQAAKAAATGSGATALPSGIPRLTGPAQAAAAPAADFVAGMGPGATTYANTIPRIGNAPTQALPAVNAALQEGAQANVLAAAARTAAGANAAAPDQPVNPALAAPAPAAQAAPISATPGGAVFGFYPQMAGGKRTTYATDAKLRTGVQATGPSTFVSATPSERTIIGGGSGQRMNAAQDPRSLTYQDKTAINSPAQSTTPAAPSVTDTSAAAPTQAPGQDVQAGPPMSASSSVVRNGNSYSGSNIAGDVTFRNPDGSVRQAGGSVSTLPAGASPMGPAAGFVPGGISTQNMGAADALAAREYAASMGRLMASGQIAAPAAGPSMNLSGGTFGFRRDRNIVADERGAQARFAYGQGADPASRARNAQLQQTAMQEAGSLARTGIQEQGANARETGRNAIAQGELDMKRTAAGFQIRAAQQLENLQNAYATETDATKRAELARQIREIQGKDQPARFKVAAGGQQIDANGVAYKVPDRVFNELTGEFADGRGAAATAPIAAPKAGEVRNGFRFKGGNPNDQANWTKV